MTKKGTKKGKKRASKVDRAAIKEYMKSHSQQDTAKHFKISRSLAWVIKHGWKPK